MTSLFPIFDAEEPRLELALFAVPPTGELLGDGREDRLGELLRGVVREPLGAEQAEDAGRVRAHDRLPGSRLAPACACDDVRARVGLGLRGRFGEVRCAGHGGHAFMHNAPGSPLLACKSAVGADLPRLPSAGEGRPWGAQTRFRTVVWAFAGWNSLACGKAGVRSSAMRNNQRKATVAAAVAFFGVAFAVATESDTVRPSQDRAWAQTCAQTQAEESAAQGEADRQVAGMLVPRRIRLIIGYSKSKIA